MYNGTVDRFRLVARQDIATQVWTLDLCPDVVSMGSLVFRVERRTLVSHRQMS